jgi:hypothetical protein
MPRFHAGIDRPWYGKAGCEPDGIQNREEKCEIGHSAEQKCSEFCRSIAPHDGANGSGFRHELDSAADGVAPPSFGRMQQERRQDFALGLISS